MVIIISSGHCSQSLECVSVSQNWHLTRHKQPIDNGHEINRLVKTCGNNWLVSIILVSKYIYFAQAGSLYHRLVEIKSYCTAMMRWVLYDDVIKWKHFPRYCPYVRGIHRPPMDSPHKGQWRRAWIVSLIYAWTNGWANNRNAGDFRRYRTHNDVNVI